MRIEMFADIFLILLVGSVIAIILSLVNRGKKNANDDGEKTHPKVNKDHQAN